jgi:hypothetical protein
MFDPIIFATVASVAATGVAGAATLAAVAGIWLYRPGKGRRRKPNDPAQL